ncbi:MAG: hypothetical protein ACJ78Q_04725 [Chloroflexia bacterium]
MTHQSVVGVFDSEAEANEVLDQLRSFGLSQDDVTVMLRDAPPTPQAPTGQPGSPVVGGAGTGAVLGGLIGVLLGWMIAIGAISIPGVANGAPAIPGVGTVLPEGVLAAAIAGLVLGAVVGALIGALLGLRVPRDEPTTPATGPREGRVLVTVHPTDEVSTEMIQAAMQTGGGYDVRVYDSAVAQSTTSYDTPIGVRPVGTARRYDPVPGGEPDVNPDEASPDEGSVEASTPDTTLGAGAEGGYGDGEARELVEPTPPDED